MNEAAGAAGSLPAQGGVSAPSPWGAQSQCPRWQKSMWRLPRPSHRHHMGHLQCPSAHAAEQCPEGCEVNGNSRKTWDLFGFINPVLTDLPHPPLLALMVPVQAHSTKTEQGPGGSGGHGTHTITVFSVAFSQKKEVAKCRIKPSNTRCSGLKLSPAPPESLLGPRSSSSHVSGSLSAPSVIHQAHTP